MTTYLPSQQQIAFALALVRSKPPTLTIRDYFENLKSTVVCTARGCTRCQKIRPEDYWRGECQRLQGELDKSVASCSLLKSEIRRLNGNDDLQLEQVDSRKRRTSTASGARASKRTKTGNVVCTAQGTMQHYQHIMSHVYDLQQLLSKLRNSTDLQKLTNLLCAIASMLAGILQRYQGSEPSDANVEAVITSLSRPPLQDTFQVAARIFIMLLKGFDDLDLHSANRSQVGSVAYHVINIFRVLFDLLDNRCSTFASSDTSKCNEVDTEAGALVQTLEALLHSLDPSKQRHAEIFEGFMYHLLQRAGRLLDRLVPHDPPSPTSAQDALTKRNALTAAPHILRLLSASMDSVPRSFRQARHASQTETELEPRSGLTIPALAKLQRTLIRAVFGPDADPLDVNADRINLTPAPSVRIDELSPRRTAKSRSKGKQVSPEAQAEALVADFWTCLGWETLACEGKMADMLASWE